MKRPIILYITILLFSACKKTADTPIFEDQLSESQLKVLDAAPRDTVSKFTNALFADGSNMSDWSNTNDSGYLFSFSRNYSILSTSDKKNLFVSRMTKAGYLLTDDSKCLCYPSQPNGLAYVFGSPSILIPYAYPGATCQQKLYGIDCSGMIYQMAQGSSLALSIGNTTNYADIKIWNTAFNISADFQGLEMKDLSYLPPSQFQSGDIIVEAGHHMGMVFNNGSGLAIFNSQGDPHNTCSENSTAGHGPVIRSSVQTWITDLFTGNNYNVLRISLTGTPGITSANVVSITQTSAISGGNITNEGGSAVTVRGVCWSTSPNPTVADNKTTDGAGPGTFTSSITGLSANTIYHVRAYATNSSGTAYGNEINFTTTKPANTITDIDGNVYHTITISTQVWLVENLKVKHYRNGDAIANVSDNAQWAGLSTGAWCYYNNDASVALVYGLLYNWYAVNDSRKIPPTGWHAPTDAEWSSLTTFLGGEGIAGDKMKESGFTHWQSPNAADNSSGFTAIPGGGRLNTGIINSVIGQRGYWWASSESTITNAFNRGLVYGTGNIFNTPVSKNSGYSLRCVKD
jgi:uncharacterized protein (TIGR02145 family)